MESNLEVEFKDAKKNNITVMQNFGSKSSFTLRSIDEKENNTVKLLQSASIVHSIKNCYYSFIFLFSGSQVKKLQLTVLRLASRNVCVCTRTATGVFIFFQMSFKTYPLQRFIKPFLLHVLKGNEQPCYQETPHVRWCVVGAFQEANFRRADDFRATSIQV